MLQYFELLVESVDLISTCVLELFFDFGVHFFHELDESSLEGSSSPFVDSYHGLHDFLGEEFTYVMTYWKDFWIKRGSSDLKLFFRR